MRERLDWATYCKRRQGNFMFHSGNHVREAIKLERLGGCGNVGLLNRSTWTQNWEYCTTEYYRKIVF